METDYYRAIFKRKSFHLFRGVRGDKLSSEELEEIKEAYLSLKPLSPDIKTAIRIVPSKDVKSKKDAEYLILFYSEKKENSLMNIGYLGEQLDLFLVSRGIGTLWYGIGKPDLQTYDGMDFVIMMAIHKIGDESLFRKDMFKAKRKPLEEIWSGDTLGAAEIACFAPSACNSQPWFTENKDGVITVFRYKKPGKRGIMPVAKVSYFNRIDIGIYLFILEACLIHGGIAFEVKRFADNADDEAEKVKVAEYTLC